MDEVHGEILGSLTLLSLELLLVEFKFSAFEDVAIAAAGLTWTRGNAGEESTRVELVSNLWVNHSASSVTLEVSSDVSGSLGLSSGLVALLNLLLVELNVVVLEVPAPEGVSVDEDNAVLHNGLGSNKLVVGSVVDNIEDSCLPSERLGSPGKVSGIDTEC